MRLCSATTKAGSPCQRPAQVHNGLCIGHDPDKAAERRRTPGGLRMPIHSRLLLSRWWGAPKVGGERQRGFYSFHPDRPPTPNKKVGSR